MNQNLSEDRMDISIGDLNILVLSTFCNFVGAIDFFVYCAEVNI